jgi:hypothetical protein
LSEIESQDREKAEREKVARMSESVSEEMREIRRKKERESERERDRTSVCRALSLSYSSFRNSTCPTHQRPMVSNTEGQREQRRETDKRRQRLTQKLDLTSGEQKGTKRPQRERERKLQKERGTQKNRQRGRAETHTPVAVLLVSRRPARHPWDRIPHRQRGRTYNHKEMEREEQDRERDRETERQRETHLWRCSWEAIDQHASRVALGNKDQTDREAVHTDRE